MTTYRADRNPIDVLAEEFLQRIRCGEQSPLSEYVDRHPELADEIRELFPLLRELEGARSDGSGQHEEALNPSPGSGVEPAVLMQLRELGDYRIIREVGRGGMGVVYEAEQVSLGRRVALKVLPQHVLANDKQRQRFEREAKSAARLHHTNIVPIFGVGTESELHYYVMQFIQGLPLDEVIDELKTIWDQPSVATPVALSPQEADAPGLPHSEFAVDKPDVTAANVARSLVTGQFSQTRIGDSDADRPADQPEPAAVSRRFPATADSHRIQAPSAETSHSSSDWLADSLNLSDARSGVRARLGKSGVQSASRKLFTYWQSVAHIGVQVADAMQYAHDQGVLHRDIKPANLLLDLQGTTWVTDFGLAKATDQQDITHTGDILGTLRYMPPEAFEGMADARSDVYSLGLTLYELLALRPGFGVKERHQLIKQVTTESVCPLSKVNPGIPRDLVTIVHKATDRDPAHRYQTAAALRDDLQRFLDDEPIAARRISLAERFLRWSRRNVALAVAVSTVATLILCVAIASTLAARHFKLQEARQRSLAQNNEQLAEEKSILAEQKSHLAEVQIELAQEREAERSRAVEAQRESEALSRELQSRLYQNEMLLAGISREETGGLSQIIQLTEQWIPDDSQIDYRGWEWYYLRGLAHRDLMTLPQGRITGDAVRFSRDGTKLAIGSLNGTLKIWEIPSGRLLSTLDQLGTAINAVCWDPGGRYIATGGWDGTVRILETRQWQQTAQLKGCERAVKSLDWSPVGDDIVAAQDFISSAPLETRDNQICIWNALSGDLRATLATKGHGYCVRWSPDGNQIAYTGAVTAIYQAPIDDITDGNAASVSEVGSPAVTQQPIYYNEAIKGVSICWSPRGDQFAVAAYQSAEVYDVPTGLKKVHIPGHDRRTRAIDWAPGGQHIVTAGEEGTVKIWNAETGAHEMTLRGHTDEVYCAVWSPNGKLLASGGADGGKLWDASRSQAYSSSQSAESFYTVSFSPDGALCVAANGQALEIWDAQMWTRTAVIPVRSALLGNENRTHAWAPDSSRIAVIEDEKIRFFNARSGEFLREFEFPHRGSPLSMVWSPDGKLLAIGGQQMGKLTVLDAHTGEIALTRPRPTTIRELAWSPNGRSLALAAHTQVQVFDIQTGVSSVNLTGLSNWIHSVTWNPNGSQLALTSGNKRIRIIDGRDGRELDSWEGHSGAVEVLRWSPDGTRIASGSFDHTIRIWDAATGRQTLVLRDHEATVWDLDWSPDGQTLVSVSQDGLKVFDAKYGFRREQERIADYTEAIEEGDTDPELFAKRAAAYFTLNQWELAKKDWLRAAEQDPDVLLTAFERFLHKGRAKDAIEIGQTLLEQEPFRVQVAKKLVDLYAVRQDWKQAIALYGQLIPTTGDQATWLSKRAAAYIATKQWDLARADWLRIIELQPSRIPEAFFAFRRAERWTEAMEFGELLIGEDPDSMTSMLCMQIAAMTAFAGDETDYREICERMLRRFSDSDHDEDGERTTKVCLLLPGVIELGRLPVRGFTRSLEQETADQGFYSWGWATRALFAYRSGDLEAAVTCVEKSEGHQPFAVTHAMNLTILSLVQHRVEEVDQARATLEEASQVVSRLEREPALQGDHDLLISRILLQEAESVISGEPMP